MEEHPSVEMDNIKAVIVGDTYVGKTCILLR
jgi:GTPase SAR1 family protein